MDTYLEIIAVLLGLGYLYFLIKEQKICWIFGIISSLLSIVLFYRTGLYSESILYVYYVIIGVYGYVYWNRATKDDSEFSVTDISPKTYVLTLIIGEILALGLGALFASYTDASAPYLDAHTTIFSFIASYYEVTKKLASWRFWIVINAVTILLYINRDLNFYTALTVIYLIFSFVGYRKWKLKLVEA